MKALIEIEFPNDIYKEVEFEGDPEWQDDSFDYAPAHCTHGKRGTHHIPKYLTLEDATWDDGKYTEEENKAIQNFYDKHFSEIERRFCELAESMM